MPLAFQAGDTVNLIRVVRGEKGDPGNFVNVNLPLVIDNNGNLDVDFAQLDAADRQIIADMIGFTTFKDARVKKFKTASETRVSTITPADDAALQIPVVAGVRTTFEFQLFFNNPTGPGGGFKFSLNGPPSPTSYYVGFFNTLPGATTLVVTHSSAYATSIDEPSASVGLSSLRIVGQIQPSASGNLALQWCQSANLAAGGTLLAGSSVSYSPVV